VVPFLLLGTRVAGGERVDTSSPTDKLSRFGHVVRRIETVQPGSTRKTLVLPGESTRRPEVGGLGVRNGGATRRRESTGKKDFPSAIAPKKRRHAGNRSQERTLRQESLRKNDVGANNAGPNDTQARGWRGSRPADYETREMALST
jgi:hypothetical protein